MAFKFLEGNKYETEESKIEIYLTKGNLIKKVAKSKEFNVTQFIIYPLSLLSSEMATYYTHYQIPQAYSIPLVINEWNPLINALQVQSSYTSSIPHIPVAILSPQILTPICPYTVVPEPVTNTILDVSPETYSNITSDVYCNISSDAYSNVTTDLYNNAAPNVYSSITTDGHNNLTPPDIYTDISPEVYTNLYDALKPSYTQELENYLEDYKEVVAIPEQTTEAAVDETEKDPVEFYLTLSKELFPPAKMLNIDPNTVIDEFCKLPSVSENVSWILDIEFGVPRVPVTRSIAVYDVKLNSVHCKNTPTAIHPGFEKCNGDFKKVILFYYDCVVSTWYRGYIFLKYDKSVENFQSWLLIPMQIFGMCWP